MRFLCPFFALPLVLLLVSACQEKVPEPEPPPKPAKTETKKDEPAPEKTTKTSATSSAAASGSAAASSLKIEDVKEGKGPAAEKGDTVDVHYTGTLLDGTKFDSSRDRDETFEVVIGETSVIKGWHEGLVGMKKGGVRKLTIPPDKAYGAAGRPPKIPPNSTLVFEIEVTDLRKPDKK